jgi:hypothetical protein
MTRETSTNTRLSERDGRAYRQNREIAGMKSIRYLIINEFNGG